MRDVAWAVLLMLVLGGTARAEDSPKPEDSRKPRDQRSPEGAALRLVDPERSLHSDGSLIRVGVGMMKVLTIPGVRRVTLGDPSVLRAELLDGGLIWLVGVSMGATTLRVWTSKTEHADYLVNVAYDYGTNQLINLVRSAVANMEGVLVWKNGDRIILEGMTCTEADTERAAELAAASPDRLVNLTKFSPVSRKFVTAKVNEALAKAGFGGTTAVLVGSTFFLKGSLESEADQARAGEIVRAILAAPN